LSAARSALREVFRLDLTQVAPWSGLIRAVPVVALAWVGVAIGSPRTAVTLGVGANLVAIVSLVGAVRVPVGLLVADVAGLGLATFVGSATVADAPLHLGLLALWCFCAGLLVVFGLGPATAGVQSVIAFVVFGRFVDPPLQALELGGLVVVGASVEAGVLLLLRLPPTLRAQRAAIASAYRRLGELVAGEPSVSSVHVGEGFDRAGQMLEAAGLFGRTDVRQMRGLVDEGRRLRVEIAALGGLRERLGRGGSETGAAAVDEAVGRASSTLAELAARIERPRGDARPAAAAGFPAAALDRVRAALTSTEGPANALLAQCLAHLEALAGQLRAARSLLESIGSAAPRAEPAPRPSRAPGDLRTAAQSELSLLRASIRPQSSTFRHAVRLAVAVPGAELLGRALSLPRSYWVAFAVVVVLKPDYSSLFRVGLARVVGTVLGGTLAALVVGGLHPGALGNMALVALTAWAAYSIWPASFAAASGFVTALVLILLSTTQPDTLATATDRLTDTVIGGAIALTVYVVWPTWSRADAYQALAALLRAEQGYLTATLAALQGRESEPGSLRSGARATRLAWAAAESTVGRSLQEPRSHRIDPELGESLLAAARRIILATHSLRAETERGLSVAPYGDLAELSEAIDGALAAIAVRLVEPRAHAPSPNLREIYTPLSNTLAARKTPPAIALQLDEIVDAVDTMESLFDAQSAPSAPDAPRAPSRAPAGRSDLSGP
jgi:hypothetical protein